MKVKTDELRDAFKVCDFVPLNTVLETSQYLKIRQDGNKLTLSMTGVLQAEASVTGQSTGGKWSAYVDRKIFKTFISTSKDAETELFYKDKLTLKCGQRLEQALHAQISGYESWTPKSSFDLTDEQKAFVKMGVKYLPNMAGIEHCEAIWFDKERTLVTDTISMIDMVYPTPAKSSFVLPPDIARFISGTPEKIAVEKGGVGVALPNGFVYQPLSSSLDNYPFDKCKEVLVDGSKAKTLLKFKADEFLDVLKVACQFLPDKASAVTISVKNNNLSMGASTNSGLFQKGVKVSGAIQGEINLRGPRLISWFEYASDNEVEYARVDSINASVFRFVSNKHKNTLVIADL